MKANKSVELFVAKVQHIANDDNIVSEKEIIYMIEHKSDRINRVGTAGWQWFNLAIKYWIFLPVAESDVVDETVVVALDEAAAGQQAQVGELAQRFGRPAGGSEFAGLRAVAGIAVEGKFVGEMAAEMEAAAVPAALRIMKKLKSI